MSYICELPEDDVKLIMDMLFEKSIDSERHAWALVNLAQQTDYEDYWLRDTASK